MNVLSFDSSKVDIDVKNNIVKKISSNLEYEQIRLANEYLDFCPIILDCGLKIKAAPVIEMNDNKLVLHFCQGLNLEHAMRFGNNNKKWLLVFREMLEAFQKRGFLWNDIAPRNMIFNSNSLTISIFDFEKKMVVKDSSVEKKIFAEFFRRYAYEEFSCFLSKREQACLFHGFLLENIENEVCIDNITSNRKKMLLNLCFGLKKCYLISEMNVIEDMMSEVATPINVDGHVIYPMFFIEKIIKKGGYNEYLQLIKFLSNCSSGAEKFFIIKEFSRRLLSDVR